MLRAESVKWVSFFPCFFRGIILARNCCPGAKISATRIALSSYSQLSLCPHSLVSLCAQWAHTAHPSATPRTRARAAGTDARPIQNTRTPWASSHVASIEREHVLASRRLQCRRFHHRAKGRPVHQITHQIVESPRRYLILRSWPSMSTVGNCFGRNVLISR